MTKIIIEADLSSEELEALISEVTILHRDVFKKPLVLQKNDSSGSLPSAHNDIVRKKMWVIDVDNYNASTEMFLTNVLYFLEPVGAKIKAVIEIKNRFYLITEKFDIDGFKEICKGSSMFNFKCPNIYQDCNWVYHDKEII